MSLSESFRVTTPGIDLYLNQKKTYDDWFPHTSAKVGEYFAEEARRLVQMQCQRGGPFDLSKIRSFVLNRNDEKEKDLGDKPQSKYEKMFWLGSYAFRVMDFSVTPVPLPGGPGATGIYHVVLRYELIDGLGTDGDEGWGESKVSKMSLFLFQKVTPPRKKDGTKYNAHRGWWIIEFDTKCCPTPLPQEGTKK